MDKKQTQLQAINREENINYCKNKIFSYSQDASLGLDNSIEDILFRDF